MRSGSLCKTRNNRTWHCNILQTNTLNLTRMTKNKLREIQNKNSEIKTLQYTKRK